MVALPNGKVFVKDEDELEDAYQNNEISKEEFLLAQDVGRKLVQSLQNGENELMNAINSYYQMMKRSK